jgi:hypothetical protein
MTISTWRHGVLPRAAILLLAGGILTAIASCGGGGGGDDSPFPDDLPTAAEVLARAYESEQLLAEVTVDPYSAASEDHGGTSYAVRCLPVMVEADRGMRFASATESADAEALAADVVLPTGFVESERWTDDTALFWDIAARGSESTDGVPSAVLLRLRVIRREALDTRKAEGLTALGRVYGQAALQLPSGGSDAMQRGTPGANYRDAAGLATLAALDWWLCMRDRPGANLYDLTSGVEATGPAERIRYTQVVEGDPDQVYLGEVVYRIDPVTVELVASFRLLAQYAGQPASSEGAATQ